MSFSMIDLFAGVGGLSQGFHEAGWEVRGAVEWEPDLAEHLELNHRRLGGQPRVLCEDVSALSAKKLLRETGLRRGELDLLAGGPPCQGFSVIGKRNPVDRRNGLLFDFVRLLHGVRSRAFLIENVPGLLNFQNGKVFRSLIQELQDLGYVVDWRLVNAAACGVPQLRRRVIVVGSLEKLPDLAELDQPASDLPTAWEAIADLPSPFESERLYGVGAAAPYRCAPISTYAAGLRGRKRVVTRWEPAHHTDAVLRAYESTPVGKTDPRTRCWRIEPNGPIHTLRAGSRTRTACRPIHPFEPRVITIREAARLHSFSDVMEFPKRISSAHVAIGNAVPPLMGKVLAERFLEALEKRSARQRQETVA